MSMTNNAGTNMFNADIMLTIYAQMNSVILTNVSSTKINVKYITKISNYMRNLTIQLHSCFKVPGFNANDTTATSEDNAGIANNADTAKDNDNESVVLSDANLTMNANATAITVSVAGTNKI